MVAVDYRPEAAAETVAQIESEGGEAVARTADATREDDCRALVENVVERWGRIDVLHNNVGIGAGDAGPERIEEADWDRILAVNLKTPVTG